MALLLWLSDIILTGGIILIGLAEAAHLTAVITGWSFSRCANIFAIGILGLSVMFAAFLIVKRRSIPRFELREGKKLPWLFFAVLALGELAYVAAMQGVCIEGDMTLETVVSFLETDAVYQVNPLTGNPYSPEMPLRLKILCLPTLYSSLCRYFGIVPERLVYGIIPVLVLLAAFLVYYGLAAYFFPDDSAKRGCFMLLLAVLLGTGDYMLGMDGFGVLHCGFMGVTIRGAVLLPYTVSLMLRGKYGRVLLCVLAEACIVWTFYGLGACALVAAGMLGIKLLMQRCEYLRKLKEDEICRNS